MFKQELDYFIEHQDELVKKYEGKVLVIVGAEVVGVYDNTVDAYLETIKEREAGSFMVQPCQPGAEAYTVSIGTNSIIAA